MELEFLKIVPMCISGTGAIVSAVFAFLSYRMNKKLIENKSAIEELNSFIELLQKYRAIINYPEKFSDEEFVTIFDLKPVQQKVAVLRQHENLSSKIKAEEWSSPLEMEDLETKITNLKRIRNSLW